MTPEFTFAPSLTSYQRRKTRTVHIGDIPLGSDFPIRVQSMTTTDTLNTAASVDQIIRMVNAGCEYARLTAPSLKEAENLRNIKKALNDKGIYIPLIADIHFTPNAAELAARIVEKVRINPGNYADKKKFETIEYTDAAYEAELQRIREKFLPLVRICKEYGTAMRIGTNHGSLSDRIMSRYGDNPVGMVASAMEFLEICRDENYHNIVLSMKASNPQVMVQAYRLLVAEMNRRGMDYPLHVGVTEAGEGEDGRTKSAMGIGTLLEDGLGDTVRVSLTEDPEFEIPIAKALVNRYAQRASAADLPAFTTSNYEQYSPYTYEKRLAQTALNVGGGQLPRVVADWSHETTIIDYDLKQIGYSYDAQSDKWSMSDQGADFIYLGNTALPFMLPSGLRGILNGEAWQQAPDKWHYHPLWQSNQQVKEVHPTLNFWAMDTSFPLQLPPDDLPGAVLVLKPHAANGFSAMRRALLELKALKKMWPVILQLGDVYPGYADETTPNNALAWSTDAGGLLMDGFGDGIWLTQPDIPAFKRNALAFGILQAARVRISKTEYISCPSCGRTLFDLQETTALIRSQTDHLKGIKIGIMGCIVNGPGEMADADYGYVGSGVDKITLYRGKEVVQRNIPSEGAVNALIELIKDDGNWVEKP